MWVLKEQGQSWDGVYFCEIILQQHVIPFLQDSNNVLDTNEVIFLHDKVPCMKANATQHLLEDEGIKFWGNSIWPGNSPDMNPAENIVKTDTVMIFSKTTLGTHLRMPKMTQTFSLIYCAQ